MADEPVNDTTNRALPDGRTMETFKGPCTCTHAPEQHGWWSCKVKTRDFGCDCEAHWVQKIRVE